MSMSELFLILAVAIIPVVFFLKRDVRLRWSLAVLGCVTLAAVLTPPDLYSTFLVAPGCIVAYYFGTRHYPRLHFKT